MTKETKVITMNWLKGVLSNQNQIEKEQPIPEEVEEVSSDLEVLESSSADSKSLLSKDNQDKVSLDLIVSVENMLYDRQLNLYKLKDLEERLNSANELISQLKHDQVKKEQLFQEKLKEINALEGKLTNKQMSYDQLLEDYKEFQNTSKFEYEKLTNQLEKETNKYNKLNEESTQIQYQYLLKIKDYEDKIRNLEVENQKYMEQYETILEEKSQLMESINDFTERMSFSFNPKSINTNLEE